MILYVNGDSHSAAAEAVNEYSFADDDPTYRYQERRPHPANVKASFGQVLARIFKARMYMDAESASSNYRILRTTKEWLTGPYLASVREEPLLLLGWTTWEREEWLHEGTYYQVNSSGVDWVPKELRERYKRWIVEYCNQWRVHQEKWHNILWDFHCELKEQKIKHLFFNAYSSLDLIDPHKRHDWGDNYYSPYDSNLTYYNILKAKGFKTRGDREHGHYMADAHEHFAQFLKFQLTKASR